MNPEEVRKLLSLKPRGPKKSALTLAPAPIPLPGSPKNDRAERDRIRRTQAQEHERERKQFVDEARDARIQQHSVYYKTTENVDLVNTALFRGTENAKKSADDISFKIDSLIRVLHDHGSKAQIVSEYSLHSPQMNDVDSLKRAFEFAGSVSAWKKAMNSARELIEQCKTLEDARVKSAVRAKTLMSGMQAASMSCGLFFLSSYNLGPNAQQTIPADQIMEIEMRGIEEEPMLIAGDNNREEKKPADDTAHVKTFRVADATLLKRAISGSVARDDETLNKLMAQCARTAERCHRDGETMIEKMRNAQRQMQETLTAATAETDYISYVHRIVTI